MAIFRRDKKGKIIKVSQDNDPFYITGRKTKVDDFVVGKLEYAFAIGANVSEACSYAGISRDVYYDFLKRFPEFSDRFADLRDKPIFEAKESLMKGVKTNPELALKYLERRRPKEFGNNLKLTDGEGNPLPVEGGIVNNNLIVLLEDADKETRQSFLENARRLIASKRQDNDREPSGDAISLQPDPVN